MARPTDWALEQGAEYASGHARALIGKDLRTRPMVQVQVQRGFLSEQECGMLLDRAPILRTDGPINQALLNTDDFWGLYQVLWRAFQAAAKDFGVKVTGIYEPPLILDYTQAKGNDWHSDYNEVDRSKVSVSIPLCSPDDYTGGTLEFAGHKTLVLDMGDAAFFAGYLAHRVTPIHTGRRKVLVAWAGGPALR